MHCYIARKEIHGQATPRESPTPDQALYYAYVISTNVQQFWILEMCHEPRLGNPCCRVLLFRPVHFYFKLLVLNLS